MTFYINLKYFSTHIFGELFSAHYMKMQMFYRLAAIITAVGVIVVYIVTAQVFLVLGKGGVINPLFAGLAPTIGFIACGAWRLLSNRN